MKSYREHSSKQETFSIRKLSVGVVSLAVAGLVTVNTYGAEVKADEATRPATETTSADTATSKLTSTTVTEGNKTVTTTYVESPELETAKATATTEGVTVTEEAEKIQPSIAAAEADNKAQTAGINTVVEDYKKAKTEYEAKSQEITLIEKRNAEAEATYKKQVEDYNSQQAAYDKALEEYNAKKAAYDAKVAEKAAADQANAEAKAKYDAEMATYKIAKEQYDIALQAYQEKKSQYDKDKLAYDKLVATKAAEDVAKAKYEAELATYKANLEQYGKDFATYQTKLAEYKTALAQYTDAKSAYDKYMNDNGFQELKDVEAVQDLTFQREAGAIHTIDGISTYLTRDAQARLNTSNVGQYDSNKLTDTDIVTTSPWANNETSYLQIKEGDKFDVTYDNLNQSSMREKTYMNPIKRVIYRYKILSLPSNDGKGIAKVSADPTETLTVGASSDQDKPVKVAVDIEFYDENGNQFDLTKHNAIVALNSLNHWTGASYVDSGDKPRALTVEAKDQTGNVVRGTWNPYVDGSSMSIENNAVVVKTGSPDFGSAKVTISAENPLKIVAQKATWNGSEFVISEESVIDATSVNASGSGEGHSIGTDNYTFEGKDDVIGSYTIDPTSGQIFFTPKKKFEAIEHQESVNIGNNKYIAIPNSSVSYDATTKEVTSLKDNQYIEHGSIFNGESSPTLRGWDDPTSPYLYYGGAGLKMSDGHLVFTANGANAAGQPTVYWFAINSNVGLPKKPGEEPKEPTKPKEPTAPTPPTITVENLPAEPTKPTPPTAPLAPTEPKYTVITVDVKEPTPPTPPTKPTPPTPEVVPDTKPVKPEAEVKWHKNKVVTETDIPTPPTPVPPTPYNPPTPIVPSTPEVSEQPTHPQTPALPNTGTESSIVATLAGAMVGLLGLGLARKKKEN